MSSHEDDYDHVDNARKMKDVYHKLFDSLKAHEHSHKKFHSTHELHNEAFNPLQKVMGSLGRMFGVGDASKDTKEDLTDALKDTAIHLAGDLADITAKHSLLAQAYELLAGERGALAKRAEDLLAKLVEREKEHEG